jgi:hypothetical protein
MMKNLQLSLLMMLLLTGCSSNDAVKLNPMGRQGDMLLVIDDSLKSTQGGIFLQKLLLQPVLGLPQEEELFTLSLTPQRTFTKQLKALRNIIVVQASNQENRDTILFYHNVWASDQTVAMVYTTSGEELYKLLNNNEIKLVSFFLKAERTRLIESNKKYPNITVMDEINKQWGISLTLPNTYLKNKSNQSFTWLSNEGPVFSIGILIYDFPYVGEGSFSREYLINKRDSVLQKNLAGPSKGSYMSTELDFPVIYKTLTIENQPVTELRGLWKVNGDMMGGPFLSHAHYDKANNRVLVTEGYVYSPEKPNKRNLMQQAEAVLYSYRPVTESLKPAPLN